MLNSPYPPYYTLCHVCQLDNRQTKGNASIPREPVKRGDLGSKGGFWPLHCVTGGGMEKRQITRQELVAAALKLGARPETIRQWFHRGIPYRWQIRLRPRSSKRRTGNAPFVYSILAFIVSTPPSGTSPSPILRTPAGVPVACSSRSDRTKLRAPPVASPRRGGTGLLPRLLVPLPHHLGRRE